MHLRARGEAEEVDTLVHAADADLGVARDSAVGDFLTHAVVHLVAELGIAAVDKQGTVDGVGIDAHVFECALFNADSANTDSDERR